MANDKIYYFHLVESADKQFVKLVRVDEQEYNKTIPKLSGEIVHKYEYPECFDPHMNERLRFEPTIADIEEIIVDQLLSLGLTKETKSKLKVPKDWLEIKSTFR